jgi:glutamate-1-semialdehyde 2,1-aminomutase
MSLTLVTELNDTDRKLLHRAIDGFVPAKVFDAHTHLFHSRHFAEGKRPAFLDEDRGYGMADFQAASRDCSSAIRAQEMIASVKTRGCSRRST